jgi:hypothetical protein
MTDQERFSATQPTTNTQVESGSPPVVETVVPESASSRVNSPVSVEL